MLNPNIKTNAKFKTLFKNKQQRYSMTWQELAEHYNLMVASCIQELGKVDLETHEYLSELKKEVEERIDNPKYISNLTQG